LFYYSSLMKTIPLSITLPLAFTPVEGLPVTSEIAASIGAFQAAALVAFISGLNAAGYDVSPTLPTTPAFKPASVPANGKGKFERAFLDWKGQDRMHHKGDKETESREVYARRMLIEGGHSALVEQLDNEPDSPVGGSTTDTEPPAYDDTPGEPDDSALT
jgi:hypothetical protein